jgi:hypothetical protein
MDWWDVHIGAMDVRDGLDYVGISEGGVVFMDLLMDDWIA